MEKNVKHQIGLSRFAVGALTSFIIGLFIADKISLDFGWAAGISIGLVVALILFWREQYYRLGFIVIVSLILGLTYYHYWDFKEGNKILPYNQQIVIEKAEIISKPEITNNQKFLISYDKTKIQVETAKFPEYKYGDILKISGTIKNPAEIKSADSEFNYGNYLLKKGIRGQIQNPEKIEKVGDGGNFIVKNIYKVGDAFEESINRILPEPFAAFQAGLILGVKRNIPNSLMSDFNRTGTTHIVAVSGYNVTIIIIFLATVLMMISRKVSFWGSMLAILGFVILTGAVASVLRAGILTALILVARYISRRPYYPVLLLLVAFVMLLFNPYALKNDVSFQLSFLAFIGLLFLSTKISELKFINKLPNTLKTAFSETMGAQIMVLPILLYNFGILSIVAPLANILILPLVPAAMGVGFIAAIGGMIWVDLGRILANFSWVILKYILTIVEILSALPIAAVNLKVSDWWWIPIYFLLVFLFARKKVLNKNKQGN